MIFGLLIVGQSLAAPERSKRQIDSIPAFTLPELPGTDVNGFLRESGGLDDVFNAFDEISVSTYHEHKADTPLTEEYKPVPEYKPWNEQAKPIAEENKPVTDEYKPITEEYNPIPEYNPSHEKVKPPHQEYWPSHEEYGPPAEEYGPPHEEYGPPIPEVRIEKPTTTTEQYE